MLVVPGVHVIYFELVEDLVCQKFITYRTGLVAANGKLTRKRGNKTSREMKRKRGTKADFYQF